MQALNRSGSSLHRPLEGALQSSCEAQSRVEGRKSWRKRSRGQGLLFWKVQRSRLWFHLEVLIKAKDCISERRGAVSEIRLTCTEHQCKMDTSLKKMFQQMENINQSGMMNCECYFISKWQLTPRSQNRWWRTWPESKPRDPRRNAMPDKRGEGESKKHRHKGLACTHFTIEK